MHPDFWGIFHDGTITKVDGNVPGDVQLFIEIPYLRKMFPGIGDGFFVLLNECSCIEFCPFDQPAIQSPAAIEKAQPEVLYVRSTEPIVLDCTEGSLSISYRTAHVFLETGESVSYEQLVQACDDYWSAWEKDRENDS